MNIEFPDWYDDFAEFECEIKGSALNFEVVIGSHRKLFNFYDICRFIQDAKDEINMYGYFRDESAVIVKKVTRKNIVEYLKTLKCE